MNTATARLYETARPYETAPLYETDFYGWIQAQAAALRAGNFAHLDMENLIEEIESMGKSEKRELESRLEVLLMPLLKWQFQPTRRGTSWELTIKEQRHRLFLHLAENASLKSQTGHALATAYTLAVYRASKETKKHTSVFPKQCPWTFEQVADPGFWPNTTH